MYVAGSEVQQKSLYWMSEADDQSTGESKSLFKYPAGYKTKPDVHKAQDKSKIKVCIDIGIVSPIIIHIPFPHL